MPINFNKSQRQWEVRMRIEELNKARTPGRWNMDNMEFPPGDPDREFIEYISEHIEALL